MELEELKSAWAQYDKKLTDNLILNKKLLQKINLGKSKKEMNAPLTYEALSLTTGIIFLIYIVFSTIRYSNEIKFLIPGIISTITFMIYLSLSVMKIRQLTNIDFYYSPIVELQKSVSVFKKKYLKYKKYELFAFPLFAISTFPIGAKALRNLDLYQHPGRFIIGIVLSLVLYYPMAIWGYKILFDRKVRNTNKFLAELNKFEEEE
jgi:hypothetical protein